MKLGPYEVPVPTLLAGAYAVAVVVALLVAATTSGAAFDAHNPGWEGLSGVQETADASATETTTATDVGDYDRIDPDGTVVLLLAPGETTAAHRERLESVAKRGGTVVVASQDASSANPLLADLGTRLRVDGAVLRDEREYAASPAFPLVSDVRDHPYVRDAEGSALNYGTAVALAPADETSADGNVSRRGEYVAQPTGDAGWGSEGPIALANTSSFAYLDRNGDADPGPEEVLGSRAVVAAERVGDGEVVVVGDPSAFINAMLEREPNRALVAGIVGEHRRLVLDRVGDDVPPLVAVLLAIRDRPALGALAGLLPLLGVLAWERGLRPSIGAPGRLPGLRRVRDGEEDDPAGVSAFGSGATPDREAIEAYLAREHPNVDERDRERVLGGIMGLDSEARSDDRGD